VEKTQDTFLADMAAELERAEQGHPPMNSLHEAWAVIKEEVDELWDECRKKRQDRKPEEVRTELLQIATMCWRASRDLGLELPF
jgi:NTP pyrophosphatase (non-canonical NTP hydrolase)